MIYHVKCKSEQPKIKKPPVTGGFFNQNVGFSIICILQPERHR
jgi:hypothetical protein